jgi:hypothetical protein
MAKLGDLLAALFAPPMEPTHDPVTIEQAARASERRIIRDEIEREGRMRAYAERWPAAKVGPVAHRSSRVEWRKASGE